ncbi:HNH endonuclease [Arthrobacter sp. JSM 101049]|uniref:HNH endonuclease n=1 Tax=Arthrobacter sp. JSM 101049 TaxID=929097 RepID=UPI00356695D5
MALEDLTDTGAVIRALHMYDDMGRDAFLAKYGFRPAQKYWLSHEGRRYDSKAIAGVAHLNQTGTLLSSSEFTGGINGAVRILKGLGFDVTTDEVPAAEAGGRPSFAVIWNPGNWTWDQDDFESVRESIAATGGATGQWSTGSRWSGIEPGDRVFLFLVGSENRGLIGSGHAASEIEPSPHWDGQHTDEAPYIKILWDALVDPEDLLSWDQIQANDPDFPDNFQSGGVRIDWQRTAALESLWLEHIDAVTLGHAGEPPASGIPVSYTCGRAKRRNHQRRFRALLFRHYEAECWICGFDQIEILEAAHIVSDAHGGAATVENGRLMCPNHHRALDVGLFGLGDDDESIWMDTANEFLAPERPA